MIKSITLLFIFSCTYSFSQTEWNDFTGKQKAFFYQLTRKIENMEPQVFHLFEFTDSIPYVNDTLPDYPYVEKLIVADSSKLILHKSEFSRKNNGIISDISTHYAAWELDLMLQFRNSKKDKFAYLKPKLKEFEKFIIQKAPQSAIRTLNNGTYELTPSLQRFYAPNLTINEKMAAIKNSIFTLNDQLLIIRSIYYAQEKYINKRAKEIFEILGGDSDYFINFLVGAGDGDNYSELESVLRTKYNRPLPDPKAFFNFETETKLEPATKKQSLFCKTNPIKHINTIANRPTKVHFDVWGYHPERQTTIVIQKAGNSYILYGNDKNRYLTPDSSFESGSTYWRLIYELEHIHIAELREMIYGKKGYDYHIAKTEKQIESTLLYIKKSEKKLNAMRYAPIPKPKVKKKKLKKKTLGTSDQAGRGHITGKTTKNVKDKNKEQSRLVHLNTQLQNQKRILKQLKIDKEKAFTILAKYETQLDLMKKNVGDVFIDFKKTKHGDYIFDDGSTFNYLTQDFTFQPNNKSQSFDIITIAFGEKVFSKTSEEVFVHINITHPMIGKKHTLYKEVSDKNELTISDSIQMMEFFTALAETDKKLLVSTYGGGIIDGKSGDLHKNYNTKVIPYDKGIKQANSLYIYNITIDNAINLHIKTYRNNMIPYQFSEKYGKYYLKAKSKNAKLNEVDFYTTLLAKKRMDLYLISLQDYANQWLKDDDKKAIVLKKLKKVKNKNNYSVTSFNKIKLPKK